MDLKDRQDQLSLLALIARGLGCEDIEGYQPASVEIAADLADPGISEEVAPGDRRAEVVAFLTQTGGG
jgi:hypothetical protein